MNPNQLVFNPRNTNTENEILELINIQKSGSTWNVLLDNKTIYKNSVRANCIEWVDINFNNGYNNSY